MPEQPKKEAPSSSSLATLLGITGAVTGVGGTAAYKTNKLAQEGKEFLQRGKSVPKTVKTTRLEEVPDYLAGGEKYYKSVETTRQTKGKLPGTSTKTSNPLRIEAQNRLAAQKQIGRMASRVNQLGENASVQRQEKAVTAALNAPRALELAGRKPGVFQRVTRGTPLHSFAENVRAGQASRALNRNTKPEKGAGKFAAQQPERMTRGQAVGKLAKGAGAAGAMVGLTALGRNYFAGNKTNDAEKTAGISSMPPFDQMVYAFKQKYPKPTQADFNYFTRAAEGKFGASSPKDVDKFKGWAMSKYNFN